MTRKVFALVVLALPTLLIQARALRVEEPPLATKAEEGTSQKAWSASDSPAPDVANSRVSDEKEADDVYNRQQQRACKARRSGRGQGRRGGWGSRFVDTNQNGVCDRLEQRRARTVAQRGRQQRRRGGWGPRFVDTNQNGVCDRVEQQRAVRPPLSGARRSGRCCRSCCFVDCDGDGICDRQATCGAPAKE